MNRSACPVELCACDVNGTKVMEKMPLTIHVSSRIAFQFNQSTLNHGPCAIASCKSPTCSCVWLFANKFLAGLSPHLALRVYTPVSSGSVSYKNSPVLCVCV